MREFERPVGIVGVDDLQRWRLATGYMSATELFGWPDEPGGLFRSADTYTGAIGKYVVLQASPDPRESRVREVTAGSFAEDELERVVRGLPASEREVVLRMLRGLARK